MRVLLRQEIMDRPRGLLTREPVGRVQFGPASPLGILHYAFRENLTVQYLVINGHRCFIFL